MVSDTKRVFGVFSLISPVKRMLMHVTYTLGDGKDAGSMAELSLSGRPLVDSHCRESLSNGLIRNGIQHDQDCTLFVCTPTLLTYESFHLVCLNR